MDCVFQNIWISPHNAIHNFTFLDDYKGGHGRHFVFGSRFGILVHIHLDEDRVVEIVGELFKLKY